MPQERRHMDYTPQSTGVLEPRPPRLLDHVRERIRLRHYSIRTEQAYVGWGRRFILANDRRHPRELGPGGRGVPYPLGDAGQCGGGHAAGDEAGEMAARSPRMASGGPPWLRGNAVMAAGVLIGWPCRMEGRRIEARVLHDGASR